MSKEVTIRRNCIATLIPSGEEVTLAEGATYSVAQSLGNSVTLRDLNGLYRVGENELDALGQEMKDQVMGSQQKEEAFGAFWRRPSVECLKRLLRPRDTLEYRRSWDLFTTFA